jgi:hypothetical protein
MISSIDQLHSKSLKKQGKNFQNFLKTQIWVILANLANLKRDRKILLVNGWAGTLNVGKDVGARR